MWEPDVRTLFLILFLANVFLALMLFAFCRTQKTYYGLRTWMFGLMIISCGYFLFMLRGEIPDLLSVIAASVLVILSAMLRADSTRRYFWSKPVPPAIYAVLIPFALGFVYYTYIAPSVLPRDILSNLILAPAILVAAYYAACAPDPESRPLRLGFAASLAVVIVLLTARNIVWLFTPGGDYTITSPDPLNLLLFTVVVITDILTTGLFLMLNMARSQSELRASEERYRNLADNLPDYVVVHDGKHIRFANLAAARILERSQTDLAGQPLASFLTPASADTTETRIRAVIGGASEPAPAEIDIQLPKKSIRHCIVRTAVIHDNGVPAFMSVLTDITERKAAEDALSRANKKLTILSSITRHDIKNQLLPLSAYLDLAGENLDKPRVVSDYLKKAGKISGIIGNQIDFTRAYESLGTTAPVWQNVAESIRRAETSLPAGNVRISVDRPDLEVFADPLIEKVFFNLIDNALRYGGNRMETIRFYSRKTPAGLILACEDDGAGIPEEDKKKLFSKGFGKNTGLGLFLSREILSITGITITETGEPGKGALFEMLVPAGEYRFTGESQ